MQSQIKGKLLSSKIYPEYFPFNKNDTVINVGCGEGPQAVVYSKQYKNMIGADINRERLKSSKEYIHDAGITNYKTICCNVETLPVKNKTFDKALAIDIIEHVRDPQRLCLEIYHVLKNNGKLLITFPVMYEKYFNLLKFIKRIGKIILGRKSKEEKTWNPDDHHHQYSIKKWNSLVEACGFTIERSRATTLFPPLFLLGFPRFWFKNKVIYKVDGFFSSLPVLKRFGQTLLCVYSKK